MESGRSPNPAEYRRLEGPSDPVAIERDPEAGEIARMLVKVELPGKAQRLNITLDEGLVAAIDQVASNRSAFLAAAARAALAAGMKVAGRKARYRVTVRDADTGEVRARSGGPRRKRAARARDRA